MARQTPEGSVKAAVKKRLEQYGVLPFIKAADQPECRGHYWMPVQGQFAVHGVHDFTGCWEGFFWSIETKAPDNKVDATEPQRAFQAATVKAGGISFIGVRDASVVDELYRIIQERKKQCFSIA